MYKFIVVITLLGVGHLLLNRVTVSPLEREEIHQTVNRWRPGWGPADVCPEVCKLQLSEMKGVGGVGTLTMLCIDDCWLRYVPDIFD